jgi:sugar lactone lactonase YvrE
VESVYAGSGPGFANGSLFGAKFSDPLQIAMDSHGNIYVADNGNNAIRLVSTSGSTVSTLVGAAGDSPAVTQTLSSPTGVAVDGSGNVYYCAGDSIYKYKP